MVKSDQFLVVINIFPRPSINQLKLTPTRNSDNVLQSNFLEGVPSFFYHIFGILNSFNNPCTSENIDCHFLVILKNVVQIDNPLRTSHPLHMVADQSKLVS